MNVLDPVTQHHVRRPPKRLQSSSRVYSQDREVHRRLARLICSARADQRFVPVLAHRFARERLKALGQRKGGS